MDSLNFRYSRDREQQGLIKHRWGGYQTQYNLQNEQQTSLLAKKDSQIKRLQLQLQNQRKKSQNALKMLDSFRNSHRLEQQTSQQSKSEISRRLKAEEQARRLKLQNDKLRQLLQEQIIGLQMYQKTIIQASNL